MQERMREKEFHGTARPSSITPVPENRRAGAHDRLCPSFERMIEGKMKSLRRKACNMRLIAGGKFKKA